MSITASFTLLREVGPFYNQLENMSRLSQSSHYDSSEPDRI